MHQKALAWDKTVRFERRCLVFEIEAFSPKVRAMEMALHWCCAGPHTLRRGTRTTARPTTPTNKKDIALRAEPDISGEPWRSARAALLDDPAADLKL
jgi:hypothetical protein